LQASHLKWLTFVPSVQQRLFSNCNTRKANYIIDASSLAIRYANLTVDSCLQQVYSPSKITFIYPIICLYLLHIVTYFLQMLFTLHN
jgi:hypothetical protein